MRCPLLPLTCMQCVCGGVSQTADPTARNVVLVTKGPKQQLGVGVLGESPKFRKMVRTGASEGTFEGQRSSEVQGGGSGRGGPGECSKVVKATLSGRAAGWSLHQVPLQPWYPCPHQHPRPPGGHLRQGLSPLRLPSNVPSFWFYQVTLVQGQVMLPLSFVPPAQGGRSGFLLLFTAGPSHCPTSPQTLLSAAPQFPLLNSFC